MNTITEKVNKIANKNKLIVIWMRECIELVDSKNKRVRLSYNPNDTECDQKLISSLKFLGFYE